MDALIHIQIPLDLAQKLRLLLVKIEQECDGQVVAAALHAKATGSLEKINQHVEAWEHAKEVRKKILYSNLVRLCIEEGFRTLSDERVNSLVDRFNNPTFSVRGRPRDSKRSA